MYHEGEQGAGEFHRRQMEYQDKMSPLGKRHLGRKYFRLAQEAWIKGDREKALKLVSLAHAVRSGEPRRSSICERISGPASTAAITPAAHRCLLCRVCKCSMASTSIL